MASTIFLQEKNRQGNYSAQFNVQSGIPKKIHIKAVSSEFTSNPNAIISLNIERSLDSGASWKYLGGFSATGGNLGKGDGLPGTIISLDGQACLIKITGNVPNQFSCGLSFEVL